MLLRNLDLTSRGRQLVNGSCGSLVGYAPASYEGELARWCGAMGRTERGVPGVSGL